MRVNETGLASTKSGTNRQTHAKVASALRLFSAVEYHSNIYELNNNLLLFLCFAVDVCCLLLPHGKVVLFRSEEFSMSSLLHDSAFM